MTMRRRLLPCSTILLALAAHAELRTERIFGKEIPTGPYKHPASICALDNGDLYLTYYGGEGEYAGGTAVYGSRLASGSTAWTAPKQLARDPLRSLGNGVAWQAPDGKLWLFYVVRFGDTWSSSRIAVKISSDRGESWSDASMLRLDEGWMVRGKPILLHSGDWLLPIYDEKGGDRERLSPESASLFLIREARSGAWKDSGRIRSKNGNIQPSPVELEPGHVVAWCRRGGGYGRDEKGYIVRAESRDGGRTWSPGVDTDLPNPNSAVEAIKLQSGRVLLVYNPVMSGRSPLVAAISEDGGKTWPRRLTLATGRDSFAYPSAVQTKDGRIHVVYTSAERTVIHRAVFEEQDLGPSR
jgi:predicted neuraminidase